MSWFYAMPCKMPLQKGPCRQLGRPKQALDASRSPKALARVKRISNESTRALKACPDARKSAPGCGHKGPLLSRGSAILNASLTGPSPTSLCFTLGGAVRPSAGMIRAHGRLIVDLVSINQHAGTLLRGAEDFVSSHK